MPEPLSAYQIIALADSLWATSCKLVGSIINEIAATPSDLACASILLARIDRLAQRVSDNPDIDMFHAELKEIAPQLEALVERSHARKT